jgi:hypothetical protein
MKILEMLAFLFFQQPLIKYINPNVPMNPTPTVVLVIIFLPSVIMATMLVWRYQVQGN